MHWPCMFPQYGPGRKHMRTTKLQPWQRTIVLENPGNFARGLFHADGYRGINRVRRHLAGGDCWYEYPRYLFTNESGDILRLCVETLEQLGVAWRFSRRNAISVARREAVARLDECVGQSTDGSGCLRRGVGDQDGSDVVGPAGVDREPHHVVRGAERVGQRPGQREPG